MQAWPGRGSDVSCLSGLLCLPVRFVARSFSPSTPLPPQPPLYMQGRGRRPEGEGKRETAVAAARKGRCPLPTDSDHHHPVGAPESKRAGQQGRDIVYVLCGGGTECERRGSGLGRGPRKKVLGANVGQSTYLHIRPAQPNPIQAVPRSFLSTSTFPVELELVLELAPHLTESEE